MKIAYETEGVRVVCYPTPGEAIVAGAGKISLGNDVPDDHALRLLKISNKRSNEGQMLTQELLCLLRFPIYEVSGIKEEYQRTLALVTLEKDMNVHTFRKLLGGEYYPAGLNESMSYLSVLRERGVEVNKLIQLGIVAYNDSFHERRLLVRGDGRVELIPFFPETRLKSHWQVVVVKKEREG